jgi:catechol 2,3-dioxygenase-like lactoylglutathione lyase family enzyme
MEVAERFYRDALECQEVVRYPLANGLIVQMAPDGRPPGVELWWEEGVQVQPSRTEHLSFSSDDVPLTVERIRALGYSVLREPYMMGTETVAFVQDPDGHLIEINDFVGRPGAAHWPPEPR